MMGARTRRDPARMAAALPLLALAFLAPPAAGDVEPGPEAAAKAERAAFWAEAARTVRDGDFAGYAALYHPDAAFVSDVKGVAVPIADQLEVWKPGFEATKAGEVEADVAFRFTNRLLGPPVDPKTAHESGVFRYVSRPPGEAGEPAFVRFEALLVRTPAGWRWVLERQREVVTEAEWDAAAP